MIRHGWTDYIPTVLWVLLSARGLWKWRLNAKRMTENLQMLRENGRDEMEILFARTDQLMDSLRSFAFANGLVLGLLSFFVVRGWDFTKHPVFLRVYGDYTLVVLLGAFFVFMLNGEIYGYVLDKIQGKRQWK